MTMMRKPCDCGGVARVIAAVALLPVHPVLHHPPVTDTSDSSFGDGGTPSDDLSPTTIPDEATRPLFHNLYTESAWGVTLVTVALDRDVSLLLKRVVHPAAVFEPVLRVRIFRPDTVGSSPPILCRAALVALDAGSCSQEGEAKEEAQEPPTRRSHTHPF